MRIGLVGLGRMGQVHAANLLAHPEISELLVLVRGSGRTPPAVHPAAHGTGVQVCEDLDQLLRHVDGLVVATSTAAHPQLVRSAAQARVPVFCEKPVSTDRASLAALRDELTAVGVPLMIGFQRRYDDGYRSLRDAVRAGGVGRPQLLRTVAHDRLPPDRTYLATCGGLWHDLLIHDFDAMSWVLGERAVQVYAQETDGISGLAVITFAGGARGTASGARRNGQGYDARMEVFGDLATLATGFGGRLPVRCVDAGAGLPGEPYSDFADRFRPAFETEIACFVDILSGRSDGLSPPEAALHALEIADACALSQRLGRAVAISPTGQLS